MADIRITSRELTFLAKLERQAAPETCRYFESLLPYKAQLIHVRWSGEACWIPLGDGKVPFGFENATSYPPPGAMIFYPGGFSETEILLAYGAVRFASKLGQLAGNHFLTIVDNLDGLTLLGRRTLSHGAQDILVERL